ncbi:MAG TPA: serine/threonine-protein kinase, partial [Urbifossiella sp.]|nr:serine/threonine-protein kinase [Urbifossiella sp.]
DHENLVPVYSVGVEQDTPYLVMPYLRGVTLDRHLGHRGRLPVGAAIAVGRQTLCGLAAAHSGGIVHRDVKMSNLFLECVGRRFRRVRVLDYGLARPVGERISPRSNCHGTPAYMSPEQHLDRPLDDRTDVFSTGMVLYRALTGRHPFAASSQYGLITAVLSDRQTPVLSIAPDVPRWLSDLVDVMLSKRPGDRPSAAAAAAAFTRCG